MNTPTVSERHAAGDDGLVPPTGHDSVVTLIARTPVYVSPDATLRDAARILAEESIGVLLVPGPGGPAGLLSERDIVTALAEGAQPDRDRVRDYMTPDLASVPATATIAEAEDRMLANEIRHLVVTKGPSTIGVLSIRDIMATVSAG